MSPTLHGVFKDQKTIFALATGPGRSAVAIIRISGPLAGQTLKYMAGVRPDPRRTSLRLLRDQPGGETIDHALVLWFPAPGSFTGEDVAEFHIHGGRAVIESTLHALGAIKGLRMAEPGEFARRAFENGRLDLTEVEGLADLINAETEAQRRQALKQSSGALGALYEDWRLRLVGAMARIEAALDFTDEGDVPDDALEGVRPAIESLIDGISAHLADDRRGEILRDGFQVVIAGPPNAGKSSLLNILAKRDAAIVSDEAGTTRDIIEVHLDLEGYPVLVTDTAGIHKPRDRIEQEGIRRTISRAADADLIIWLMDAGFPNPQLPHELAGKKPESLWWVYNKSDLLQHRPENPAGRGDDLYISAKTGAGIDALAEKLACSIKDRAGTDGAVVVTRARHRLELERAAAALRHYLGGDKRWLELRAEDLRQAADALGRITGRVDVEDILDQLFAEFCIGK